MKGHTLNMMIGLTLRKTTRFAALATLGLVTLLAVADIAHAKAVGPGDRAPAFTLKDIQGKSYKLADYRGKAVVILDFGRFTCAPCRQTATDLEKLHKELKGDATLQIFQVNLDGPLADQVVPKGIQDLGITFPVLLDTAYAVAGAYGVEVIPFLVVIDPDGVVRYTHTGYSRDLPAKLKELHGKFRPK